jgi:alpha-D-ribose 1-methylphosphonate 5-triphosphate synthase subunit PhnI
MPPSGITSDTILGQIGSTVGVEDCTDLPGLPKSSKFCLEGRPYTKLPGMGSAMTTGDMRQKIKELRLQAKQNLGIPNAAKVDQEELAKLQDIVKSTKQALSEQESKLKEIKDSKHTAMQDLAAQKRILSMAKDARQQRLAWRSMDAGMSQAYKEAGFKLPLSAGR